MNLFTTAALEQRKKTVVERWPLWEGRDVIWHLFLFPGCNIFFKKIHDQYVSVKQKPDRNRDQRRVWWPFTICNGDCTHRSVVDYLAFVERFLAVVTSFSGRYRWGEVAIGGGSTVVGSTTFASLPRLAFLLPLFFNLVAFEFASVTFRTDLLIQKCGRYSLSVSFFYFN